MSESHVEVPLPIAERVEVDGVIVTRRSGRGLHPRSACIDRHTIAFFSDDDAGVAVRVLIALSEVTPGVIKLALTNSQLVGSVHVVEHGQHATLLFDCERDENIVESAVGRLRELAGDA